MAIYREKVRVITLASSSNEETGELSEIVVLVTGKIFIDIKII